MGAASAVNTWEGAVRWLREQPDAADLVRDAYYDDPLLAAAKRYRDSSEWREIASIAGDGGARTALDIGAGRGIASYALAREGFRVTALEPDPSPLVGAGAIRSLAREAGVTIDVVEQFSETLPFDDQSYDVVFCRAVLHHTRDLPGAIAEMQRVLKPGGLLLAVREHVISHDDDLPAFLDAHPLHNLYGGEHAFRLNQYVEAITASGLRLERILQPLSNPINYWPHDERSVRKQIGARFERVPGLSAIIRGALGLPVLGSLLFGLAGRYDHRPGRLYSFVARRQR